jgi:hypothetical protein
VKQLVVVLEWYEKGSERCVGTRDLVAVEPGVFASLIGARVPEGAYVVDAERAQALGVDVDLARFDYFASLEAR